MVDYTLKVKRLLGIINENKNIKELNVYDVMFFLGTSQYIVAKTVLRALERSGIVKKIGNNYIIKGREYDDSNEEK